jgi:prepilin-type N-terminal cleavage/methylation domain-containing protein/prepilin-type processing-associated H-X9-DG protein
MSSSPRSKGFTLVELLVVIGIIALLVSILLPTLGRAREKANQVKCQAQIRQILQGMILHSNDHHGYMPLAGQINTALPSDNMLKLAATPDDVQDPRRQKYEYYNNGTAFNITSTPAGIGKYLGQDMDFSSKAALEKSMNSGITRQIMVCPSDKQGGRWGHTVNNGGDHWSSYAFNEAALGWWTAAQPGYRGHYVRFPHKSALMLVADANPRNDIPYVKEDPNSWMLWNDGGLDRTMGDWYRFCIGKTGDTGAGDKELIDQHRHKGRIIIGFADGHADNLLLSEGGLDKVSLSIDFRW